jgi:N-methylhydantoinase A
VSESDGFRIGVDVGGTFTDLILVAPDGNIRLVKTPSTLEDQSEGFMTGLTMLAADRGLDTCALLEATDLIVHGTTTADNTMIEMNGALTGLITTEGHRDEIDIRRGFKEEIWDPAFPPPVPIAPRRRRMGVPERLDFRGNVVRPLDEQATRKAVRRLKRQGVESIAVCLLFSYVNADHECEVRRIIEEEYPGVRISLSHQVMPTAPEFERTSTTLVDAYVGPRVEKYLRSLETALRDAGYQRDLLIMQSNGGIMSAPLVAERAITALGSGPTGGVMGACAVGEKAEVEDFIAIDMGGTSYEVCLVRGARPEIRSFWNWQHRYLVGLPMVEMHSIGAGGGSIAFVEAGALQVGPQSAKAEPGPICYGRGGEAVTVTDANVVLGYINPTALCGGAFKLNTDNVHAAIDKQIGEPLGLSAAEAAYGVYRIVNANMTNAIRRVSSQSGYDPRDFALVVYGGNGPVHAGKQAEELGIKKMIVPKTSPAFSALGLLIADYVVDIVKSYIAPSSTADVARLQSLFEEMRTLARTQLAVAGIESADVTFEHSLNLCYPGQTFDISVAAVMSDDRMTQQDFEATIERFHDVHEETHTYAAREEEPVLRAARVHAVGVTPKPTLNLATPASGNIADAISQRRPVYFGDGFIDTPVYNGDLLGTGHELEGPAVIEEAFTTIVLSPGDRSTLDENGNYVITIAGAGTPA